MKDASLFDIETLESAGRVLLRLREKEQAIQLLALALRLRREALAPVKAFCGIHEPEDLAEVVHLEAWSKRV